MTQPASPKYFVSKRPSLRFMRFSFALFYLYRESVLINTSSCGWPRIFSFIFFKTRCTSCSTRIRAFALIPFMEYDVVFPSVFVNSFTPVLKEDGHSFAIHCFELFLDCSFPSRVCCADSSLSSACMLKISSSSATSKEEVVTWIGVVWISSRILRHIFSETFSSSLERESAVVLTEPAICAVSKLNYNTYSCAFQSAGGNVFVWKKCVTDLWSVRTIFGFVASQRKCANS